MTARGAGQTPTVKAFDAAGKDFNFGLEAVKQTFDFGAQPVDAFKKIVDAELKGGAKVKAKAN